MSKLHLDASTERHLDRPHINHGRRAPAHRVEKGVKSGGRVEVSGS
jgi:hypothetical protein